MKTNTSRSEAIIRKPAFNDFRPVVARVGLACAVAFLVAGFAPVFAGNPVNVNPGVLPPESKPYGKTYGEWSGEWWKWTLSIPIDQNPNLDPTGAFVSVGQSGPLWFLPITGPFGGRKELSLTVPSGKGLFVPWVIGFLEYPCPADPNFQPAPGQTLEQFLTETVAAGIDVVETLAADVDGVPLQNLFDYRAKSGLVTFTADPSLLVVDPCLTGEEQQGVSDGYWLLLAPLAKGQHTVHLVVTVPEGGEDVTYHIAAE